MTLGALGKYALVSKHAAGGMAEIYLAKQLGAAGFERNVVVKRLHAHLTENEDFVRMFLDEARLASRLTHPNIVAITDLGEADGSYYIAMEYLAGEDLATLQRLARRAGKELPPNVVAHVVAQAAMGLHFAHEAKDDQGGPLLLIHRDVSPSNIFVTYDGQVKVLDFGIAKAESQVAHTAVGIVRGKHQYMSPEQASGKRLDRRTDVYSLGVTLYELLTQTRPFAHDTDLATLKAVLEGDYPAIDQVKPDLPAELVSAVKVAMSPERDERYESAMALALALEQLPGALFGSAATQAVANAVQAIAGAARVRGRSVIPSYTELQASGAGVAWAPGLSMTALPAVDGVLDRVTPSNPAAPRPSVPKSSPGTPGVAYASSASPVPSPSLTPAKLAKGTPGAVRLADVQLPAAGAGVAPGEEAAGSPAQLDASAAHEGAPATVRLRPSRPGPGEVTKGPADETGAPATVRLRPLVEDVSVARAGAQSTGSGEPPVVAAQGSSPRLPQHSGTGDALVGEGAPGSAPLPRPSAPLGSGAAKGTAEAEGARPRQLLPTGSSASKLGRVTDEPRPRPSAPPGSSATRGATPAPGTAEGAPDASGPRVEPGVEAARVSPEAEPPPASSTLRMSAAELARVQTPGVGAAGVAAAGSAAGGDAAGGDAVGGDAVGGDAVGGGSADVEPARPTWLSPLLVALVAGAVVVLGVAAFVVVRARARPVRPAAALAQPAPEVVEAPKDQPSSGLDGAVSVGVDDARPNEAVLAAAAITQPAATPPDVAPREDRPVVNAPTPAPDPKAPPKRVEPPPTVGRPASKPVAPSPSPAAQAPRVEPHAPIEPTPAPAPVNAMDDAKQVVAKFMPRLLGCFTRFPGDAPSKKGRTDLTLWVDGTGRVTKADVDLSESSLSRCVRGVSKEMRFQASAERAAKLTVPLNYEAP